MQGPPPQTPSIDPPDTPRVVRQANPEEAWSFQHHDSAEIVRHVYQAVEAHAEAERRKDEILRELDDATTRLNAEASQPVIDERDQRRRSQPQRHR